MNVGDILNFAYTGSVQTATLEPGTYRLEVWGEQGGNGNADAGVGKPRTYRKDEDPDPYVGVGRNDPCPCGSGKKFKNCHGRNR